MGDLLAPQSFLPAKERETLRSARIKLTTVGLALVSFCIACMLAQKASGGADLSDELRTALRRNAGQLSPITVSYTQELFSSISAQETLNQLGIGNRDPDQFFYKGEHQSAWQDGKLYSRGDQLSSDGVSSMVVTTEASFDGSALYFGDMKTRGATLFKRSMSKVMEEEPESRYLDFSYFEAAGYHVPSVASDWVQPQVESGPLYLLENGGKLESINEEKLADRVLIRLKIIAPNPARLQAKTEEIKRIEKELKFSTDTPERKKEIIEGVRKKTKLPNNRVYIYYLDKTINYAVRRWEQLYEPNLLLLRGDCDQFQQQAGRQVWLPRSCEIQYQEFDTKPGVRLETPFLKGIFKVTKVDLNPIPDGRFTLIYSEPGTYVRDSTLPEAKNDPEGYISYTIPASLNDLDDVISRARRGEKFYPTRRSAQRHGWKYIVGFIAANVVAVVVYAVYRHRKKAKSAR